MALPWNPAAPPSPGEAAWAQPWKPQQFMNPTPIPWSGQADESYRWFTPESREFYEANPTQAYQGFLDWGFGDRERPLLSYARNYYGRAYAAALRGQEGAEAAATGQVAPPANGPHWTDALDPNLVYQIRQSFRMQSASNRGVVNQWMLAGRMTG